MEIEYKGGNTVIISTKPATIVVDPKLSVVGLKDVATKGAIELATEERFALTSPEALLNIEGPGEYGVAQFDIRGVAAQRHLDSEKDPLASTMYRIEAGDIRLAVVGNIYEKVSEQQLEELGVVDVLILPVGGNGYTLDATGAASLVRQVDPKVVVPVHYADDALTYEVPQEPLELFVKELGAPVEEVAKMKLKSAAQLPATLTVYALVRS
ncbi:Zn-dependent hydrolase [Candidatus Saccharibacteria bacterium]|nr:Zn-dependent hydrolase [Candidatus Saccharibacteria bacterium]MBQ68733.1 Zn-dependent hydrolase [Candidatus Saccharibacteria bacterium]|tara:strand:- start:57 stop:689 length:633 start_codon:yes stop_codon:yes gene_type:complete